jgi:hypothetical protein
MVVSREWDSLKIKFIQCSRATQYEIADKLGYNIPTSRPKRNTYDWHQETMWLVKVNGQTKKLEHMLLDKGVNL